MKRKKIKLEMPSHLENDPLTRLKYCIEELLILNTLVNPSN